jgi:hypothetical protein
MTARYATRATVEAVRSQLTALDLAALRTVSELRFVSGDQLGRLHFGESNARAARRALLRLTRLDCLARLPRVVGGVRAGSAGFVYCLGLLGQRLAVTLGWQPDRRRRRSHLPGTFFLNHCLAIAELHTLLREADRSCRIELLELSAEPACWRSYVGIGGRRQTTMKPDSYVRLGVGEFEDSYFMEVDRGTEGSATLSRKLAEYVAYEARGIEQEHRRVFPKVLWLTSEARRAEAIEAEIERLAPAHRGLFAVALQDDVINTLISPAEVTHTQSDDLMEGVK